MRRICRLGRTSRDGNKATRCKVKVKHPWALVCKVQSVKITSTIYMQIMTDVTSRGVARNLTWVGMNVNYSHCKETKQPHKKFKVD